MEQQRRTTVSDEANECNISNLGHESIPDRAQNVNQPDYAYDSEDEDAHGHFLASFARAPTERGAFYTTVFGENNEEECIVPGEKEIRNSSSSFNCSDRTVPQGENPILQSLQDIAKHMKSFVDMQENIVQERRLQNHGLFAHLDEIMRGLPEQDVMELWLEFIRLARERANKISSKKP